MIKKILYLFCICIFAIFCIGFAGFNSGQIVSIKFIGLRLENEFWIFIIAALLIGMLLGYLFAISSLFRKGAKARSLNKKLVKAEKQLSVLQSTVSE